MSSTAMVKQEAPGSLVYRPEQVQLIKDVYAKGASDNELALFIEVAQRKGLDIFSRQVHLVKRYDSQLQREVMEPQTGIDGYRLMAERTGKYEGQLGPFWCGGDGEWKDVWLSDQPPSAAKVGTLKAGCREPFWAVALYKEYVQTRKDGQPNSMWKKMAANQLAKCAEALSLRKAFPGDLAGIYTQEEMAQASNGIVVDATPEAEPAQVMDPAYEARHESILSDMKAIWLSQGQSEAAWDKYSKGLAHKTCEQLDGMRANWRQAAAKAEPVEAKPLSESHSKVLDLAESLKECGISYEAINKKIASLCGGVYAVDDLDDAQAAKVAATLAKWLVDVREKAARK